MTIADGRGEGEGGGGGGHSFEIKGEMKRKWLPVRSSEMLSLAKNPAEQV